jgi:glycosyltransferase involved in cell wall biosynthesis
LLSTQAVGVYHTDLSMQSVSIGRDEHLTQAIESYSRWFYGAMDRIAVPTFEYMNLLEGRGYDRSRMILFHRGIDTTRFAPQPNAHAATREKYGLREGITLLFAGRIAPDKNLDFLVDVHAALRARRPDVNLVIAGAGPYERDLRHRCAGNPRIVFAGLLAQVELAALYAGSDLFLFPSTTDTFGMAVLEAQACGVPAIVSDRGGPKEIVVDGVTGLHARADHLTDWVEKVEALIARKECRNGEWEMMVKAARSRVLERHDWDAVLTRLTAPTNERFRTQPSVSTASSWGQEAHA